jgi:putative spermidine/putrescine transport system ATP-binding protein
MDAINTNLLDVAINRFNAGERVVYEGVTKEYGEVTALYPTAMTVEKGEFFSIIGPSGSGKTTLLGVTAGFIPPTRGRVLVGGRDLVGVPPFQRNIGMVFQSYSLFPHMTVAQNISFPLRMRKLSRADQDQKVRRMLEIVRLTGLGDRYPRQLSGGQQQRVALARAAIYDPLLLLMDEPLSALDKNLREDMQRELKSFQSLLGTTVIYVTHDQHEAASMSQRIAIMDGGRVVQVGTPRELYDYPGSRFVASFLGAANIFEVDQHHGSSNNQTFVDVRDGFQMRASGGPPGGKFVVCVRPERIRLSSNKSQSDNEVEGVITDVIYSSGMIHYCIRIASGKELTQKTQVGGPTHQFARGDQVFMSWSSLDSQLVCE